jgi:hypothetical protein
MAVVAGAWPQAAMVVIISRHMTAAATLMTIFSTTGFTLITSRSTDGVALALLITGRCERLGFFKQVGTKADFTIAANQHGQLVRGRSSMKRPDSSAI